MKKLFIILFILFIISIIHDNMPMNKELTNKDKQMITKLQQATCERNHGMWNNELKECYFN